MSGGNAVGTRAQQDQRIREEWGAPPPPWVDVSATQLAVGDVVQDAYANPAVVISVPAPTRTDQARVEAQLHAGIRIMMVCGSDRGRVTGLPTYLRRATDKARITWARDTARAEGARQGLWRAAR